MWFNGIQDIVNPDEVETQEDSSKDLESNIKDCSIE